MSTTTEVERVVRTVHIGEEQYVVLVPSVKVTFSGDIAEVAGYLHVAVVSRGDTAVHYYVVGVEEWSVGVSEEEIKRKVEQVLKKANEKAEEYAKALSTVLSLGARISFRGNLASRDELPEWLRKHLPP